MKRNLVVVALALAALGTGCASQQASALLLSSLMPVGHETATISLVIGPHAVDHFSGTIAGRALAGKTSAPNTVMTKRLCPAARANELGLGATITGTFNGQPYVLYGCDTTVTGFDFKLSGHVGSSPVSGSTNVKLNINGTGTAPFSGAIGKQRLSGSATITSSGHNDSDVKLVAHLTVSG